MIKLKEDFWIAVPEETGKNKETWHDSNGVILVINSIGYDKDLFPILSNIEKVRAYYRNTFAKQGLGMVECELGKTNGHLCVKVIGKRIQQGEPATYIGSIAIPLSDRSFVLSFFAQEEGVTGARDAAIMALLMNEGDTLQMNEETGSMDGWTADPYKADFEGPCLKNQSEERKYDDQFPDHPLSKVRKHMDSLPDTISIELKKSWWKIW